MALTPGRWLALLILGGAALFAYVLPPREVARGIGLSSPVEALSPTYLRAAIEYRVAVRRLLLARARDSLQAALHRGMGGADATVNILDPDITPPARAFLDSRLARERERISPPRELRRGRFFSAAVSLSGFGETVTERRFGPNGNYAFTGPPLAEGACIHALFLSDDAMDRLARGLSPEAALAQPRWRGQDVAFGPCLFYEAYGAPGPAIQRWLRDRDFDLALTGQESSPGARPKMTAATASLAFHPTISVCAAARIERCLHSLLEPTHRSRIDARPVRWAFPLRTGSLGEEGGHFLADMARDLGPERFRAFWTADLPPDSAFMSATGEPLGAWAARWAGQTFGPLDAGPAPMLRTVILSLLLMVAGCIWAIGVAAGRQI